MTRKKLKVIPIYKFFQIMDLPSRATFFALWLGLIGLTGLAWMAHEDPVRWSLDVVEVPAASSQEVPLSEYSANYRTLEAQATATQESVLFGARMIGPVPWLVWVFIVSFVLGWTALLTAATYVKGYYGYGLVLPYALMLMMGDPFSGIWPDFSRFLSITSLLLTLLPMFALQQKVIRLNFMLRFLIFLGLVGGTFALVGAAGDWTQLHRFTAEITPVMVFVVLLFIFFTANEPNNLLVFLGTNGKNRKLRAPFPVILGIWIVLVGLQFMMLQDAMGWKLVPLPEDFPFRPFHLVALSAVVMVGTKQNLYPVLKDFLNNRAMSFGLLGFGILAMGMLFYHTALGEYLYASSFERLAIILIFLTSLFHFFYLSYNFMPLLRARLNLYFITMLPKRLMYVFVVMATFLVGLALEASEYFKSRKAFATTHYNRLGDADMLEGNPEGAMSYYNSAWGVSEGTVKGNYNFALLKWTLAEDRRTAGEHFRLASQFKAFPYAYINHAAMEMEQGLVDAARYHLYQGQQKLDNPYLHNNLAQVYLLLEEPDSAILQMKAALALHPEQSTLYGNLGKIYLDNERPQEAAEFFTAGLALEEPSPVTLTNALFLNLLDSSWVSIPEKAMSHPNVAGHEAAWYNLAVGQFREGNLEASRAALDSIGAIVDSRLPDSLKGVHRPPSVLFLEGALMFEDGEVENSLSRMAFLDYNFPQFKRYTSHFLGTAYHGKGIPEMAAEYFRQSAENGRPEDGFLATLMLIDQGNHDEGFRRLGADLLQDSTLFDQVVKETAMLQMAHGQYLLAQVGFDPSTMQLEDWARVGRYAGRVGKIPEALEAFRKYIALAPKDITPYLEMGRICLALGDSMAVENLAPGLEIDPDNRALRIEMARARLRQGDLKEARTLKSQLEQEAPNDPEVQFMVAEVALQEGDSARAVELLEKVHEVQPLRQEVVVKLSEVYRGLREDFKAHELLIDAYAVNSRNADYMAELARVELLLSRIPEAASSARSAIELTVVPGKKAALEAEFAPVFESEKKGDYLEEDFYFEE